MEYSLKGRRKDDRKNNNNYINIITIITLFDKKLQLQPKLSQTEDRGDNWIKRNQNCCYCPVPGTTVTKSSKEQDYYNNNLNLNTLSPSLSLTATALLLHFLHGVTYLSLFWATTIIIPTYPNLPFQPSQLSHQLKHQPSTKETKTSATTTRLTSKRVHVHHQIGNRSIQELSKS